MVHLRQHSGSGTWAPEGSSHPAAGITPPARRPKLIPPPALRSRSRPSLRETARDSTWCATKPVTGPLLLSEVSVMRKTNGVLRLANCYIHTNNFTSSCVQISGYLAQCISTNRFTPSLPADDFQRTFRESFFPLSPLLLSLLPSRILQLSALFRSG